MATIQCLEINAESGTAEICLNVTPGRSICVTFDQCPPTDSASLQLGTGANNAYYGDKGKIAYDHSQTPHAPSSAEKNVQSDWNQANTLHDAYIKNKPDLSQYITCDAVPGCEEDPVFAAWLLATPPIMPGEETDPVFSAWLLATPPVMPGDNVSALVNDEGYIDDIWVEDDVTWPIEYLKFRANGIEHDITEIPKPDGLVSGGIVTWTGGLTFAVAAAAYYIDGTLHTSAAGNAWVPAADPTDPRLDVIILTNTGNIGVVVGVAQPNPSEPSINPLTQVKLTTVFLQAGATDIIIVPTDVYVSRAEWNAGTNTLTIRQTGGMADVTVIIPSGGVDTDELVKYDAGDPTAGYLADKIIAGTNITIEEGAGVDENKLKISASGGSATDELVKYDAADPTAGYLGAKIVAGDGITVGEGTGVDENKVIISNSDRGSTAVGAHELAHDHTLLHDPVTAGDGISVLNQQVTNADRGSTAVGAHELAYDHTKIGDYVDDVTSTNDVQFPISYLRYTKGGVTYDITEVPKPNGLIQGGGVSWVELLTFDISAAAYYLEGVLYITDSAQLTLDPADALLPRIDIIVVDTSGTVSVVTGVPNANPQKPTVDPVTQIELTNVLVPAGATEPDVTITEELIYDENVEWTGSDTGAVTVVFNDATSPYHGTLDTKVTGIRNNDTVVYTAGVAVDRTDFENIIFNISLLAIMHNRHKLFVLFLNSGVAVSNEVEVSLDKNNITGYQNINIPLSSFTFSSANIDALRFRWRRANPAALSHAGFYLDYIKLQKGITVAPVSSSIELTGDVTGTGVTGSPVPTTLATVNANVGTFGGAANIPQVTVDGKGRITAISNVAVSTSDEKVKYDAGDPTAGYVADKIISGNGIGVAEGTGGDANKLVITNTDKGSDYSETDPVVGAVNGLVKANGAGVISAATADTDYATPALAKQLGVDTNRFGFVSRNETQLSFDGTSTITLASVGASWSYYRSGLKYTIAGDKTVPCATPMVDGTLYYIYIDSIDGTLVSGSGWTLNDTKVPVATLYWDSTLTPKFILADERHTCRIDRAYHREHHFADGTETRSPGTIAGLTAGSDADGNKTFSISDAAIFDEDLFFNIDGLADPDGNTDVYPILYRTGVATYKWVFSDMPFKYSDTAGVYGYIEYDNAGTSTPSALNRFVNTYLFYSNSVSNNEADPETTTAPTRFFILQGRGSYTSVDAAKAEQFAISAGFPTAEGVVVYQFTWATTNRPDTVKGRCRYVSTQAVNGNVTTTAATLSYLHNSLLGIDGGSIGEYYHLTAAQHTVATSAADTDNDGYLTQTDWDTFNSKIDEAPSDGDAYVRKDGAWEVMPASGLAIGDWTEDISFDFNDVDFGVAQTWILDIKASFAYKILSAVLQSDSTMDDVTVEIAGSPITWADDSVSIDVTASVVETAAKTDVDNDVAVGEQVTLNSSGTDGNPTVIRGKLKIQRT